MTKAMSSEQIEKFEKEPGVISRIGIDHKVAFEGFLLNKQPREERIHWIDAYAKWISELLNEDSEEGTRLRDLVYEKNFTEAEDFMNEEFEKRGLPHAA
jgi:hypothetical protein